MSKQKPSKKKVVVTTQKKEAPADRSRARGRQQAPEAELLFGRQNYLYMGVGALLILLGLLLMTGGSMPSSEVWEEDLIYSWRRTLLAPAVILAGLILEIVAIFKK